MRDPVLCRRCRRRLPPPHDCLRCRGSRLHSADCPLRDLLDERHSPQTNPGPCKRGRCVASPVLPSAGAVLPHLPHLAAPDMAQLVVSGRKLRGSYSALQAAQSSCHQNPCQQQPAGGFPHVRALRARQDVFKQRRPSRAHAAPCASAGRSRWPPAGPVPSTAAESTSAMPSQQLHCQFYAAALLRSRRMHAHEFHEQSVVASSGAQSWWGWRLAASGWRRHRTGRR